MSLEEKLNLVDQMAEAYVPFLAIAGGEPLVSKDLWPVLEHATKRGIHLTVARVAPGYDPFNGSETLWRPECGQVWRPVLRGRQFTR